MLRQLFNQVLSFCMRLLSVKLIHKFRDCPQFLFDLLYHVFLFVSFCDLFFLFTDSYCLWRFAFEWKIVWAPLLRFLLNHFIYKLYIHGSFRLLAFQGFEHLPNFKCQIFKLDFIVFKSHLFHWIRTINLILKSLWNRIKRWDEHAHLWKLMFLLSLASWSTFGERTFNSFDFLGNVHNVDWFWVNSFFLIIFSEDKFFVKRAVWFLYLLVYWVRFSERVFKGFIWLWCRNIDIRPGAVRAELSWFSVGLRGICLPSRVGNYFSWHEGESVR